MQVRAKGSAQLDGLRRLFALPMSIVLPPGEQRRSAQGPLLQNQLSGPQMAVRMPEHFAVAVMGRSKVGKSALTLRYIGGEFVQEYDPTIEDLHRKQTTIDGSPACIEILDTAGKEAYSWCRRGWMQHCRGFLFVFSLVDRQTFDDLSAFHDELMDVHQNDPPPSVLVANKADVDRVQWKVADDEIRHLMERWRNCTRIVYTSAHSSTGVVEAFEPLCLAIREWATRRRGARELEGGSDRALLSASSTSCRRCVERCAERSAHNCVVL